MMKTKAPWKSNQENIFGKSNILRAFLHDRHAPDELSACDASYAASQGGLRVDDGG